MTGIAAIFSPVPIHSAQLARMAEALSLRQHDSLASMIDGTLGLAALTWNTTAESVEAEQPYASADRRFAIAMDGFLANWEELRRDLQSRGARLRNRSDAELVLHAYAQWGDDCAKRLDGEFAFVIADWRRRRFYGARDHLGLKPLFLARSNGQLLIASDIAAIVAGNAERPEPNLEFLACLAAGKVYSGEQTAWKGICSLPHAHWMACEGAEMVTQRYYALPEREPIRYRSDEEYAEHHRAELFEAVRRTSRSQVPLAFEVSGGLDSSALFAVADKLQRQGRLLAPDIRGYTLAGEPGTRAYELPFARAVAEHVGRPIAEVPMFRPPREWYAAQARADRNVPPPPNGAMSINLERQAACDGSRVLVTGIGGDEWLGGSQIYYRQFAHDRDHAGFAEALREDMAAGNPIKTARRAFRMGLAGILPGAVRDAAKRLRQKGPFAGTENPLWLRPEWQESVHRQKQQYAASLPQDFKAAIMQARYAHPWALYSRATMQRQPAQNGLELRFPFLSRGFVEFSAAVPEHLKLRAGVNKFTHRNAMAGLLPELVVNRRTKAAFDAPAANCEFLQFSIDEGADALSILAAKGQIKNHFSFDQATNIDAGISWEVYGIHAVACFLESANVNTRSPI